MDTKIAKKAVALVARAKAHHDQSEVCWHGKPGGIQGYDSQYGWPVDCYGCESSDSGEPPYEPAEIYAWALATARGITWESASPEITWEDFD